MLRFAALLLIFASTVAPVCAVSDSTQAVRVALRRDLERYLAARSKIEHISAISLSVSLPGRPNINVAVGSMQYGGRGTPATPENLWEIGSNTKSFTAAIILQLEGEGRLNIKQTVGRWLPQYRAWKSVTIERLLNMTSGIPSYDNTSMLSDYAKNPNRNFTATELIAYAYPSSRNSPAATIGYSYSNTNYLLAAKIIERVAGHSYTRELERRFLRSTLGLGDTYYADYRYPIAIRDRMVAGYFDSTDDDNKDLAPILGRDVRDDSVSWMQAAGGIVSTPADLSRWARALYSGKILAPKQEAELMSLVSVKTGKPIAQTSAEDPQGFGLGVVQMTNPKIGTVWFYEGMTLGYRMLHVYFPRQNAMIAFGLNSQPNKKDNHSGELATAIYETLHANGLM